MNDVQPRRVSGPPVYRLLGLVVLAILLVAGGAVVFAGRSSVANTGAAPLAADASQDPNANTAPAATPDADASQDPSMPGKGPGGRGGMFGQGGFGGRGGPGGPGGFGGLSGLLPDGRHAIQIASIDGSNLALKTSDGWTRTIDASTATITRDGTAITLANLKVGDAIRFAETRNTDGSYTITEIGVIQPRLAGTATAIGSDSITLSQPDGTTLTIHIASGTTFTVPGVTTPTITDVKVGNIVTATGTLRDDGSLDATNVVVFNGQRLPGGYGRGSGGYGPGDPDATPAPRASPAG